MTTRTHPPGTWLALSADQSRIVAAGATYGEAVDGATAAGELDPVLTIAQDPDVIYLLG